MHHKGDAVFHPFEVSKMSTSIIADKFACSRIVVGPTTITMVEAIEKEPVACLQLLSASCVCLSIDI